jgi:DNA mismatch repair protein MutL
VPELSPHQFYLIRENEEALRDMGFDIDRLGDDSYIIRAIPVVFHGMIGEDEITEVIVRLVEESGKREERIKVLFSTAACKASIKAGEKLSYDSMRAIVAGLRNAKIPFTCPHGRPTMIRLTKKEIEKRFKRR